MEFNKKLQELRRNKGLTQEELAEKLYVSRTAISKWESGRGYPNIESLKALASFFSVSLDELLSRDEVLTIAEEDGKRREGLIRDLVFGFLDLCIALLFFLPFFKSGAEGDYRSVSLIALQGVQSYLLVAFYVSVGLQAVMGVLCLAMQASEARVWVKSKNAISFSLGALSVLLFIISSQPYAASFAFALMLIKAFLMIKRP
jgi:transcriptional regulator with XRE-family HTH domain